jgi:hypothetical protein
MSTFAAADAGSSGRVLLPKSALLGHTGFVGGNLKSQVSVCDDERPTSTAYDGRRRARPLL